MQPRLPCHAGIYIEVKEGTGPITAMCVCGDFLELYKVDVTVRARSPESIDPQETNPNAQWVVSPVSNVGSANPIVARVLLQGDEFLKGVSLNGSVNKAAVVSNLHACKEALLECDKIASRIAKDIDGIISDVETRGLSVEHRGRALNPFPQVADLDSSCGTFLIHANRAIKLICALPKMLIPSLSKTDTNFDYLEETLSKAVGREDGLTAFVHQRAAGIRHLVDLRNCHEHPKDKKTVIHNFRLMPDGRIAIPMWYLSDEEPLSLKEDMISAVDFLVRVAEETLIHLIAYSESSTVLPFAVERIPESEIDPKNPKKYRRYWSLQQRQPE
jgi:hypothetical protein